MSIAPPKNPTNAKYRECPNCGKRSLVCNIRLVVTKKDLRWVCPLCGIHNVFLLLDEYFNTHFDITVLDNEFR